MKKSKFLLTLVVVLVLCSMLFALVACNNDEKKAEEEAAAKAELTKKCLDKVQVGFDNAFKFTKAPGLQYVVEVPVADVEIDGKKVSKSIVISVNAALDPATVNNNYFEVRVDNKHAGKIDSNVFSILADPNDVYFTFFKKKVNGVDEYGKYKFNKLELGKIMDGAVLPTAKDVNDTIGIVTGLVPMIFPEATVENNVYTLKGDLSALTDIIKPVLDNLLGNETVKDIIPETSVALVNDIVNLIKSIKPNMIITMNDKDVITKFDIIINTKWGDAKVLMTPKFGDAYLQSAIDTVKANMPKDAAEYNATQLLNFDVAGEFKIDTTVYNYSLVADLDVFCLLKNYVKYGETRVDQLMVDSNTNLFFDVKEGAESILTVAKNKNLGDDLYVSANTAKVLPADLVNALFNADVAAAINAEGKKVFTINPAALIADMNARDTSTPMNAFEPKTSGPKLVPTPDKADATKATITWKEQKGTSKIDKYAYTYAVSNEVGHKFEDAEFKAAPAAVNGIISVDVKSGDTIVVKTNKVYKADKKNEAVDKVNGIEPCKDVAYTFAVAAPSFKVEQVKGSEGYVPGMGKIVIAPYADIKNGTAVVSVSKYVIDMNGTIVKVDPAKLQDKAVDTVVDVHSGKAIKVYAELTNGTKTAVAVYSDKDGKKINFVDGKATANAISKAISFLMGIDVDYSVDTKDVVIPADLLKKFLVSLNTAIDVNVKGNDLADIVETIPDNYFKEMRVNVKSAHFMNEANCAVKADELFATAAGFADVATLQTAVKKTLPVAFNDVVVDGIKYVSLNGNITQKVEGTGEAAKTVTTVKKMSEADLVKFFADTKADKVVGMSWEKKMYGKTQTVKLVYINDVPASIKGIVDGFAKDQTVWFPTTVVYTQVILDAPAPAAK